MPNTFVKHTVFEDLRNPTQVEFAADGQVFVAERRGTVQSFEGIHDTTPTLVADLTESVHAYSDRGLLALELDPAFPANPYLYVLYTRNAEIGGPAPKWPSGDCPNPPGGTIDGCLVSGRIARLTLGPDGRALTDGDRPVEHVLVDDWCQQFPSHSIGDLSFDAKRRLYASAGEGANYSYADFGQAGVDGPFNPCGDPPTPIGVKPSAASGEGGSLRSQDLLTRSDPTGLDGTVIRINPETGGGVPANPHSGAADPNVRRIIAFGLRNPFRFARRPGSGDLWIADVGQGGSEEINRVRLKQERAANFGWPCYEGESARESGWAELGNALCERLYGDKRQVKPPFFAYERESSLDTAGECPPSPSSAISGITFAPSGRGWPQSLRRGLVFADYARRCIVVMRASRDGMPNPERVRLLDDDPGYPVDLKIGPDGALYVVDIWGGDGGKIDRIAPAATNTETAAQLEASTLWGELPLEVTFDASGSRGPGGGLTYTWDLDGDGAFDDVGDPGQSVVSHTFEDADAPIAVSVKVESTLGSDTASVTVQPGNTPPDPVIEAPADTLRWSAGEQVAALGSASDAQDGELAPASLRWELRLVHCPGGKCHDHPLSDGAGSELEFSAPDHEYPSHLLLRLRATDSWGLVGTTELPLDPASVRTVVRSKPRGLRIAAGGKTRRTPFSVRTIKDGSSVFAAPKRQRKAGKRFRYRRWSNGRPRVHNVVVSKDGSVKAVYKRRR